MPSAFVALCFVAVPSSSPLETVGVVAMAPPPGPTPELVEMTEALRQELAKHLEGVLEPGEVRQRMLGQPSAASLSDLDRAYQAAVDTLKSDNALGVERLKKLVARLEREPESEQIFARWKQAMLRLVRARLEYASSPQDAQRAVSEAMSILERLVKAAPDLTVDPRLFSKKLDRLTLDTKKRVSQLPTRVLVIQSPASDTRVFVEGREVGKAPVTLRLPVGQYRISGQADGIRAESNAITLADADVTVALDFSLGALLRANPGPGLALPSEEQERGIARAAASLGLDRVVAVSIVRGRSASFLAARFVQAFPEMTTLRQGWLRITPGMPLPGVAELAAFLATGQTSDLVTGQPPGQGPLMALDMPIASRNEIVAPSHSSAPVLSWSPVATGVLALGLGAATAWQMVVANDQFKKANARINSDLASEAEAQDYRSVYLAGKSARRNATICAAGTGVSVVTTALLSYLAFKQTGQIGPLRF